jgi:hypothetical protein
MSAVTAPVVPAKLHPYVQNFVSLVCELLGAAVSFTDPSFSLLIQPTSSQQHVFVRLQLSSGAPAIEQYFPVQGLGSNGTLVTLAAGGVTFNYASKATDLLVAKQYTAGGTPGAYYAVKRLSATSVAVMSFASNNTVQTSDTSIVEVYNFGSPAT